jgi:hypothetical protein
VATASTVAADLANLAGWLRVTAAAISFPGGVERSLTQKPWRPGNAFTWNHQFTSQSPYTSRFQIGTTVSGCHFLQHSRTKYTANLVNASPITCSRIEHLDRGRGDVFLLIDFEDITRAALRRQSLGRELKTETLANVRFGAHNGLKSDIAPCPKSAANNRHCLVG